MYKPKACLKVEIEGRVYELYCESDSPLGALHDALMQMKGWIAQRIVEEHQKSLPKEEKEEKEEVKE